MDGAGARDCQFGLGCVGEERVERTRRTAIQVDCFFNSVGHIKASKLPFRGRTVCSFELELWWRRSPG